MTHVSFPYWWEFDLEVEAEYSPERPAPSCQNPDSPKFGDPGGPEELELEHVWISGKLSDDKIHHIILMLLQYKRLDVLELLSPEAIEKIEEECREHAEDTDDYH